MTWLQVQWSRDRISRQLLGIEKTLKTLKRCDIIKKALVAVEGGFDTQPKSPIINVSVKIFERKSYWLLQDPLNLNVQARTCRWDFFKMGQRAPLNNLNGSNRKDDTFTAVLPKVKTEAILSQGIDYMLNFANDPKLEDFGIVVNTQIAKTLGRILDPLIIAYHSLPKYSAKLKPHNETWNFCR
ncbi:266_t:CDS:2 [Ambispora leptoticha]|uniref:266_t:CDS:1 n=1 Tax=Ambispora leptoticha TaxID=144679 RepID=A0A9N8W0B6_9GLOM|nr:266_t:CDS:2 [Ambispora leptoticha]